MKKKLTAITITVGRVKRQAFVMLNYNYRGQAVLSGKDFDSLTERLHGPIERGTTLSYG